MCGGDFSLQVIGRSIISTSDKCSWVVHLNKAQFMRERERERERGFYAETLNREKLRGEGVSLECSIYKDYRNLQNECRFLSESEFRMRIGLFLSQGWNLPLR